MPDLKQPGIFYQIFPNTIATKILLLLQFRHHRRWHCRNNGEIPPNAKLVFLLWRTIFSGISHPQNLQRNSSHRWNLAHEWSQLLLFLLPCNNIRPESHDRHQVTNDQHLPYQEVASRSWFDLLQARPIAAINQVNTTRQNLPDNWLYPT